MNKKREREIAKGMSEILRITEEYGFFLSPVDVCEDTWFCVSSEPGTDIVRIFNEYCSMKERNESTN